MSKLQFAIILLSLIFTLAVPAGTCSASVREATGRVRAGIEDFERGDFKSATTAFDEAAAAAPDDRRIAFDRGCALLARGEYEKAVEQFQQSALAKDPKLAAESSYNLGCTMTARAKSIFGAKPEEIEGEKRTQGLDALRAADKYYRDCLGLAPDHANARYNLETLRLWSKHIQEVWRRRDREKRLRDMTLPQMLEMLETEQRSLRDQAQKLDPVPGSPRKREQVRALEQSQRDLSDDITPLKEKVSAALTAPPPGAPKSPQGTPQASAQPTAPTPPSPEVKKAEELLHNLADEIRDRMDQAADDLAGQKLEAARSPQARAVEKTDQMFMVVAPYVDLVKKGISRQEPLIKTSEEATGKKTDKTSRDGNPGSEKKPAAEQPPQKFDGPEAAWDQKFIEYYGRIIPAKARRELEQLEKQFPSLGLPTENKNEEKPGKEEKDGKPQTGVPQTGPRPKGEEDEQHPNPLPKGEPDEQQREMKKALQTGIELAPKVEKLAAEAAGLLEQNKPAEALPKQREALKLLKEMLPKQPPKDNKDKQQQQNNQNQQDQKNNKDQNKDQKKDQKKDQQQDQKKVEKKDQQPQKPDKGKKEKQQPEQQKESEQKMTPQQAEAVLRRAKARQDEHREMQKSLQEYLYRPERVDKDW